MRNGVLLYQVLIKISQQGRTKGPWQTAPCSTLTTEHENLTFDRYSHTC